MWKTRLMWPALSPASAIRWVEILAAACVGLSTAEYLARPAQFRDSGLLSWTVSRTRTLVTFDAPFAVAFDFLFRYPNVLALLAVRLLIAISLCFPLRPIVAGIVCAGVFLISTLLTFRNRFGTDGADQIVKMIFAALALTHFGGDTQALQKICLWFITLLAALSYVTSGLTKLRFAGWRSGEFLRAVFNTSDYGHNAAGKTLMENPRFARLMARGLILAESSWPLIFILPFPWYLPWIVAGLAFHAGAALFMGLNTFFWAYIALYPAILYCVASSSAALCSHWVAG